MPMNYQLVSNSCNTGQWSNRTCVEWDSVPPSAPSCGRRRHRCRGNRKCRTTPRATLTTPTLTVRHHRNLAHIHVRITDIQQHSDCRLLHHRQGCEVLR